MQEEYSSAPEHRFTQDQSDLISQSYDAVEVEAARQVLQNKRWQEQISSKLAVQIDQRISPLLGSAQLEGEFDQEAFFSFISKSFEVFIETQDAKEGACLTLIKNAYEILLKLSIDTMVGQNEQLRAQVKLLQKPAKKLKGERYSQD